MRSASGHWRPWVLLFVALILLGSSSAVRSADYFFLDSFETNTQCVDLDSDGWTICRGDCCDTPGECGVESRLVNPGAFEFAGDTVDNDCDGTVDNAATACDGALASNSIEPLDYARALDICSVTIENPPILQRKWGVIDAGFFLADGTGTPSSLSRSIRFGFGSNVVPLAGTRIAVLSTGRAAAQSSPNNINPSWANAQTGPAIGTSSGFPSDWLAANGGSPPVSPNCPVLAGSTAMDPILLKLRVRVPTNARSFTARSFLYASDYPEYTCSPFNDFLLVLLDSQFVPALGETANPADKNLAFHDPPPAGGPRHPINSNLALDASGLFSECRNGPTGCAGNGASIGTTQMCTGVAQLAGTGFDISNPPPHFMGDPGFCGVNNLLGGGTGWLTVQGNVVGGETIELRFVVWDTSDGVYDSVVLFDDFRWSTSTTVPGTNR